jgi:hypothetical protein
MFTITTKSTRLSKSRVRRGCTCSAQCPRLPSLCRRAIRSSSGGRLCSCRSARALVARLTLSSIGSPSPGGRLVAAAARPRQRRSARAPASLRAHEMAKARESAAGTRCRHSRPASPAHASSCRSRRSYRRCHTPVHVAPAQRPTRSCSAARSIASTQVRTPRVGASA